MTKYTYSKGSTYPSESTPISIGKIPSGNYTLKAVKNNMQTEYEFVAKPGVQDIVLTIRQPYGIIYDKALAGNTYSCLTYTGECTGFTPMAGGSGNVNEGSWAVGNGTLFDAIKVGYLDGSTFVEQSKSSVEGSGYYNCFTRIPKIYEKVTSLDSTRVQLDISLHPFSGARLHPAFIVDGVEKKYIYIGRYLGYSQTIPNYPNSSTVLKSRSNIAPSKATKRASFRQQAKVNGEAYHLLWYWDWDLINKLYLLAFKSFNSQLRLGAGYTSGSNIANTGETDGKSWMYGTSSDTDHISFLGIEDWYGNLGQFIDNFIGDGGTYYAGNSGSPTDDTSNKISLGSFGGSGGYPLNCKAGEDNFFMAGASGGSSTTGMTDRQGWDTSTNIGYVGGSYSSGTDGGAFYLLGNITVSKSDNRIGARLTYKP